MTQFSTATSALQAANRRLEVRAQNLANALTPSFRAQRLELGSRSGGGTRVVGLRSDPRAGTLQKSDSGIDVAIQGEGFFRLQTPEGVRLTRSGSFSVDSQGTLVDSQGSPVLPVTQVPVGASGVSIGGDGRVKAFSPGGLEQDLGRLELTSVANPEGLVLEGDNRLVAGPSSGSSVRGFPGQNGLGTLVSGFLEGSNVNLTEETLGLLEDAQFFRVNLIPLQVGEEILGALLDIEP